MSDKKLNNSDISIRKPSRRDLLITGGALAGASLLPGGSHQASAQIGSSLSLATSGPGILPDKLPENAFSFVHLTDMHVTARRQGDKGYLACIEHVKSMRPKVSFAMMGGDLAFDGLYTEKDKFAEQIRLYREISDELGVPYYNCMGNHDVLGLNHRRKVSVDDPDFGKKMILDALEWEKPYYSFDYGPQGNRWHFAVVDSIFEIDKDTGPDYMPKLGEEQLEWLAYDLGSAGDRPKVVMTHHAAFCNIGQQQGNHNIKAMLPHMVLHDTRAFRDICKRHGVKLVLQGHSHALEQYYWEGIWYVVSPAVSAAWWAGEWSGNAPGYTRLMCAESEVTWQQEFYGWEERLDPDDTREREKIAEHQAARAEQMRLRDLERAGRTGG